jgi:CBS domain-containing protein
MKISSNRYVNKNKVEFVTEDKTIADTLSILKSTGYRAIPVLTTDGKTYKGIVFKAHIYEHIYENNGSWDESVLKLVKFEDRSIKTTQSYFEPLNVIREMPFIVVLDENDDFAGIMTHANLISILEDGLGEHSSGYRLTLTLQEVQGALYHLTKITRKYARIVSLLTLDSRDPVYRKLLVTFSKDTTEETLQKMTRDFEQNGINVMNLEVL